jgi:hypothetical protein
LHEESLAAKSRDADREGAGSAGTRHSAATKLPAQSVRKKCSKRDDVQTSKCATRIAPVPDDMSFKLSSFAAGNDVTENKSEAARKTYVKLETRLPSVINDVETVTLIAMMLPPFMCVCGPCCWIGMITGLHPSFCLGNGRNHDMAENIFAFLSDTANSGPLLALVGAGHVESIADRLAKHFFYRDVSLGD